jgi:hypothetical protein
MYGVLVLVLAGVNLVVRLMWRNGASARLNDQASSEEAPPQQCKAWPVQRRRADVGWLWVDEMN